MLILLASILSLTKAGAALYALIHPPPPPCLAFAKYFVLASYVRSALIALRKVCISKPCPGIGFIPSHAGAVERASLLLCCLVVCVVAAVYFILYPFRALSALLLPVAVRPLLSGLAASPLPSLPLISRPSTVPRTKNLCNPVLVALPSAKTWRASAPRLFRIVCSCSIRCTRGTIVSS